MRITEEDWKLLEAADKAIEEAQATRREIEAKYRNGPPAVWDAEPLDKERRELLSRWEGYRLECGKCHVQTLSVQAPTPQEGWYEAEARARALGWSLNPKGKADYCPSCTPPTSWPYAPDEPK